ncbi:metal-sensitive transcriptional regulator [Streptomyces mirabilis]|uniref:metal-sensitive transcriptional regulator n=1 Tax=Streptomyces mirabilis TaxID=68239 RepID=UPI00143EBCB9|nr:MULTISPECIES: metal-sensitive transcriptional regulator [Streptomyces]QIY71926.1 metal-sensitive transcriptional regulator [Streptomyces sp. RLB1-33]
MTTTEAGATAPSDRAESAQDVPDISNIQAPTETEEAGSDGAGSEDVAGGGAETGGVEAGGVVTDHDRGIHGYHKQKGEHLKRLRRIEGQIRGLQRMVDEDVYCIDILTQVSASTKALQSFALQLLEEHLRHCVADAALKGGEEIDAKVEEATKAIGRLLRT